MVTRIKQNSERNRRSDKYCLRIQARYVKVVNVATGGLCSIEHIDTMAAASVSKVSQPELKPLSLQTG